jgi:uncharacterized protein (DUF2249 family)
MSDAARPAITPDMKVGRLLELYPELEDVLIGLSPSFKKLKNPILRRTVAKVASLRQVAQVGGLTLAGLVNTLREAAGQDHMEVGAEGESGARPEWAKQERVVARLDARPLIEQGEHPMPQVMKALSALKPGEVYELLTPFAPAPLVELARDKGYEAYVEREEDELFRTWFAKQ